MKHLIEDILGALALLVIACGLFILAPLAVSADTGRVNGNSGNVQDVCEFKDITDGTMSWDDPSLTWTIDTPLTVDLKVRGQTSVEVTNDGTLYTSAGDPDATVSVDYTGSSSSSGSFSGGTLSGFDYKDRMDIEISGSATVTDPEYMITANEDYYLEYTITCVQ